MTADCTHVFLGMKEVIASETMRSLMALAERVARSNATVLILGESGSGKEVLARAVHHFSGRSQKPWLFELAHQGTIFLDEIAELEMKMQVKLLRVLDGVPYYRLGGVKKVTVDVRVVAATNQELETGVSEGRFRRD